MGSVGDNCHLLRLETSKEKKVWEKDAEFFFYFGYTEPEVLRDKQVQMLGKQLNVWIL